MKILFVFHEARLTGAPIALYSMAKWLAENTNFKLSFLILDGDELVPKLKEIGEVHYWSVNYPFIKINIIKKILNKLFNSKRKYLLNLFKNKNFDLIYFNTISCAELINKLSTYNAIKVWHIHELEIALNKIGKSKFKSARYVDYFVANSNSTKKNLIQNGINENKISIISPSVDIGKINQLSKRKDIGFKKSESFIIGTSGYTVNRKGLKEFMQLASFIHKNHSQYNIRFIWVGKVINKWNLRLLKLIYGNYVDFVGLKKNPYPYYSEFDIFISCSHEESFGLAALECAALKKSLICFDNTGGIEELVSLSNNIVVPIFDINKMANSVIKILNDPEARYKYELNAYNLASKFNINSIGNEFINFIQTKVISKKLI